MIRINETDNIIKKIIKATSDEDDYTTPTDKLTDPTPHDGYGLLQHDYQDRVMRDHGQ